MSIPLSREEWELWSMGSRDGRAGIENYELTEASIIYRDGWRHGVLQRITRDMNEKEKRQ